MREGEGGGDVLRKQGICNLVELEAGKGTARFEDPVRLAQDILD